MTKFVIHLYRLEDDLNKLCEQLRVHEENLLKKQLRPSNYDFKTLIKEIQNFKATFEQKLSQTAEEIRQERKEEAKEPEGAIDIYGNRFLIPSAYRYAEVSFTQPGTIQTIRLLGGVNLSFVRFFMSNIKNDFSVTTLALIGNIREIVKEPSEIKFERFSICDNSSLNNEFDIITGRKKIQYRYTWDEISEKYFIPAVEYEKIEKMTDQQIKDMIERHNEKKYLTKQELEKQNKEIEINKNAIIENRKEKRLKEKTPAEEFFEQYNKNKEEMRLLKESERTNKQLELSVQNLGKEAEKVLEQTKISIKEAAEKNAIMLYEWIDRHSIACLIEEAIECIKPRNITCRELLGSLSPGEIFDRIRLLFPQGSDTFTAIERAIEIKIYEGTNIPELKKQIAALNKQIEDDKKLKKELENIANTSTTPDKVIINGINNLKDKIEIYEKDLSEKTQELDSKQEQLAGDLKLSIRQKREIKAGGGNLAAIFSIPEENEQLGAISITGKIIAAIDTIIPLEDFCEAINISISTQFTGFDFKLPEPSTVDDIFGNLSITIDESLTTIIVESITAFIDTFVQDLINCENLDNFVAQIVNSSIGLAETQTLNNQLGVENLNILFSGRDIGDALDNSYDKFINTISNKTKNIFSITSQSGSFGPINVGISKKEIKNLFSSSLDLSQGLNEEAIKQQSVLTLLQLAETSGKTEQQINQQIFGTGQYLQELFGQGNIPDANWVVDSTGTKFEIVDGIRIIDLQELDKYLADLSIDAANALAQNANTTRQSLIDAFGKKEEAEIQISESEQKTVLALSEQERGQIKNELGCVTRHITSLLSPAEVMKLYSGNASSDTISVAHTILQKCAANLSLIFPTEKRVETMFSTFGNVAGLNNLEDSVLEIVDSPSFNEMIEPQKCGPYDSLEDFRKDLMLNIIEGEQIDEILKEVRNEKIQKLRELGNSIIDSSNGKLPGKIARDSNKLFSDAIKAVLLNEDIRTSKSRIDDLQSKDLTQEIKRITDQQFENSPVVQKIFKMVLDSFFNPINNSFESDMDGFIDAFSEIIESEEVVERQVEIKVNGDKIKMINPVFKDLLDSGLIPTVQYNFDNPVEPYAKMVDKSNFDIIGFPDENSDFKIIQDKQATNQSPGLYVSGEPSQNYLTKGFNNAPIKPVLKKINKKDIGASFKKNIVNLKVNSFMGNDKSLNIEALGYASSQEETYMDSILANVEIPEKVKQTMDKNKPSWNIGLKEQQQGGKLYSTISLNTDGITVRPGGKTDPFYINENLEVKKQINVPDKILKLLIDKYDTNDKQRKEVFDNILFENFIKLIFPRGNNNIENSFSVEAFNIYSNFINSFLNSSIKNITNTNLLKEEKLYGGRISKKIETIDFIKKCKNVLDFKKMRSEFREIHDSLEEPEISEKQRLGLEPKSTRTKETSLMIVSKIIIKLLCLETIVKALPAFDYYQYSKNLIENDLIITLVSNFINFELERMEIKEPINSYIEKYYAKKVELGNDGYESITEEEKRAHLSGNDKCSLELKKMVQKEFSILMSDVKEMINAKEFIITDADDFIKPITSNFSLVDVHTKIESEENIFYNDSIENDFVLQRFIFLPNINKNSTLLKKYPQYFTTEKINELNKKKTVNFEEAARMFSEISYAISSDFKIYDCKSTSDCLYAEPYRVGLRIVHVKKRGYIYGSPLSPTYSIQGQKYPYLLDVCEREKSGYITENERDPQSGKYFKTEYDVIEISRQEIKVNQDETSKLFISRNNKNRYMEEFFVPLREKLLANVETTLMFGFSLPLKEMASILILHTNLVNNVSKMKYLLEPSKITITRIVKTLLNMGDRTKNNIDEILQNIRLNRENMGNPAGPLDFDALKMYGRTPIQILKSIATIVDPNIALADKISGGISLAGSLAGQKINIPYSVLSLALLPFPIFGGLIPQIPPLTAYNLAPPIGPIFLALEPLLWDLPWFQDIIKADEEEDEECQDEE